MSRYFFGQGKFYMGDYPTPNYVALGNCPSLAFSPFDLDYMRQMPDANAQAADILPGVESAITLSAMVEELSAANFAALLAATVTQVNAASGKTKAFTTKKGATFFLGEVVSSVQSLIGGGTWVQGTDYTVGLTSITIPTTSAIPDSTGVTATYTVPTYQKIDPFQGSWKSRKFFFEGVNIVDGKPYAVEFFKAKLQFISGLALVTDGIEAIQLTALLLPDANNTGKYYSMIQQE